MNILVVLAHPQPGSFNHAVAATAVEQCQLNGHGVVFHDLHREQFDPLLPPVEDEIVQPRKDARPVRITPVPPRPLRHHAGRSRPPRLRDRRALRAHSPRPRTPGPRSRRGSYAAFLSIDHPDIIPFIEMRKPTGSRIEIFLLEPIAPEDYVLMFQAQGKCSWNCLIGNRKRWKSGTLSKQLDIAGRTVTVTAAANSTAKVKSAA